MVIQSFEKEKNKVKSEREKWEDVKRQRSGGSKTKAKLKRERLSIKEFQWSLHLFTFRKICFVNLMTTQHDCPRQKVTLKPCKGKCILEITELELVRHGNNLVF